MSCEPPQLDKGLGNIQPARQIDRDICMFGPGTRRFAFGRFTIPPFLSGKASPRDGGFFSVAQRTGFKARELATETISHARGFRGFISVRRTSPGGGVSQTSPNDD